MKELIEKIDGVLNVVSKVLVVLFIVYAMYLLGVHKVILGEVMFYKDYYESKK